MSPTGDAQGARRSRPCGSKSSRRAGRRWSAGKLYTALGFKLDHTSKPDYWYFKDRYVLESRVKYQKHKLSGLLEIYDENKTEIENMKANGYERIFDCGNYVFEKIYIVS